MTWKACQTIDGYMREWSCNPQRIMDYRRYKEKKEICVEFESKPSGHDAYAAIIKTLDFRLYERITSVSHIRIAYNQSLWDKISNFLSW